MQDTTTFGRVAAVLGALLLAAAIPLLWFGLLRGGTDLEIAVDDQRIIAEETDDGRTRCLLQVELGLINNSDDFWAFERATAVVDQRRVNLSIQSASRRIFPPDTGADVTLIAVIAPITTDPCPSLEDLDRGTLTLDFTRAVGEFGELRRTANL